MIDFKLCVFALAILGVNSLDSANKYEFDGDVDPSVKEDGNLSVPGLIEKYGYPAETHVVQTQDGYLLNMYRIPYGRKCKEAANKVPVLVQHGLISSAYDFLILGPQKALGYLLADNCYDVWLGNNRGNGQSRRHISMDPKNPNFWKFTWHEMGKYDLPAMIDHILTVTKQNGLHYIGHSQGTTQFFVFGALHPEYHHKIRSFHALSPIVFMKNLEGPFTKLLAFFYKPVEWLANMVGIHEFLPQHSFLNLIGKEACKNDYPDIQIICTNIVFLGCGFDEYQMNKTLLPAILSHTPAGASTKQFIHYAQQINSGKFRQFDFGKVANLLTYGKINPPEYDISKMKIPTALYYGKNDWLASLKDIKILEKKLPNVIEKYLVPFSKFNHVDFIFATDVKPLLYDRVLEVLAKY